MPEDRLQFLKSAHHRSPSSRCAQVSIPLWALVHLPVVVTLSTAAFTPNGWVHSILYVLFENAMGIVKLGAVIAGGLSYGSSRTCPARKDSRLADAYAEVQACCPILCQILPSKEAQ